LDPESEAIIGVGIVGANAGELIAEGTLAIEMGANATDLGLTIHPHPTLSETMMEAAHVFHRTAAHYYTPPTQTEALAVPGVHRVHQTCAMAVWREISELVVQRSSRARA
jgi:hypothetical protein